MPRITIEFVEGRTLEQKRALVREVTDVVARICKVPDSSVTILLQDMSKDSYSKAGVLVCDEK